MRDFSEEIQNSLNLLYKIENQTSGKKSFLDKDKIIYFQVALFKVPFVSRPKRMFLKLCHSLYGENPEICLFVPNRKTEIDYKKSTDELIDFCVEFYTDLLERHKIKQITTVMPVKQLRSEYGTFELRRKLINRFDLFLCKNSLLYNPRFLTALGKIFTKANKEPLGISFPKSDVEYDPEFEKNVKRAIFASSFYIKPFSDNYTIPIGSLSHTRMELQDNIEAVLNQIVTKNIIPGGFRNIRSIYLWPSQSKPIPFYFSTEPPIDTPKPRIRLNKKSLKSVEGEISTQPGKKVHVMRNGEVFVTQIYGNTELENDIESEDSFDDKSDEEKNEEGSFKYKVQAKDDKQSSESEDDEEVEEKERKLLIAKREMDEESFNCVGKMRRIMKDESDEDQLNAGKEKTNGRKSKFLENKKKINKASKKASIKRKNVNLEKNSRIKTKRKNNTKSS